MIASIRATVQAILRFIVLSVPASREVYQGMVDGQAGLLPRSSSYYYQGGWDEGNGRRHPG